MDEVTSGVIRLDNFILNMYLYRFFDRLEDRVRNWFSHHPMLYGFIGGTGVVLFWRGVWHTADYISHFVYEGAAVPGTTIDLWGLPIWDGLISLVIGTVLLLITGIFVSSFIGNEIILSGLRGEKKLTEKTESEVRTETGALARALEQLDRIEKRLETIEKIAGADRVGKR